MGVNSVSDSHIKHSPHTVFHRLACYIDLVYFIGKEDSNDGL